MYGNSKKNFFLKELFPTQFDTIPHIILWSVIFFVDVGIVFGAAYLLGLPMPIGTWAKVGFILYMVAAFGLFTLESWIYTKLKK